MKVLIVDDEILVRKGLSMGIDWDELGFDDVKEASNGVEALAYAKAHEPQLVITDIKMPKMDGLELIEKLKTHCPDTIVIVLSCINDTDYVRQAMKFGGAVDYIPKLSLSTEELAAIIKKSKKLIKFSEGTLEDSLSKPKVYLTKSVEEAIMNGLVELNKEMIISSLEHLFDALEKDQVQIRNFMEWQELLAIFSSFAKNQGGNIQEIICDKKLPVTFLQDSRNIYHMRERWFIFLEAYWSYLKDVRAKQYGTEIEKTINYIHQHYNDTIKLGDVADYVGINENYLCKLFKKETGSNFIDYINRMKLNKAKQLLKEGKYPVYLIAEMVGYNSESYFSRIFKKVEGMSPKAFQRQNDR